MSTTILPLTAFELVEKVYKFTGRNVNKADAAWVLASMIEENKTSCRNEIFESRIAFAEINKALDNNSCVIHNTSINHVNNIGGHVSSINRGYDFLFVTLKQILRPVWGVYWGESCDNLDAICCWLDKAELDNGRLVADKIAELANK